jgi:hypothetical protein
MYPSFEPGRYLTHINLVLIHHLKYLSIDTSLFLIIRSEQMMTHVSEDNSNYGSPEDNSNAPKSLSEMELTESQT